MRANIFFFLSTIPLISLVSLVFKIPFSKLFLQRKGCTQFSPPLPLRLNDDYLIGSDITIAICI
jgi:hypothetical protein